MSPAARGRRQSFLGRIGVFDIFEISQNRLLGVIRPGPPRLAGELGQAPVTSSGNRIASMAGSLDADVRMSGSPQRPTVPVHYR